MSEYLDKDGLVLYNEKVEKALNKKQDALIPGDGITISADGKTISVSSSSEDSLIKKGYDYENTKAVAVGGTQNPIYAFAKCSVVLGGDSSNQNQASGDYSVACGKGSRATGEGSFSEGQSKASGICSHAEGFSSDGDGASGNYSHSEGYATIASGDYSHAEGRKSNATGATSHSEGYTTTASGDYSHAEGGYVFASGKGSHAEGYDSYYKTQAIGEGSHAEGKGSKASGNGSHAEGRETIASDDYSHAEGWATNASGNCSHAEGCKTTASGYHSHAGGEGTDARGYCQFVTGRNNIPDMDADPYKVNDNSSAIIVGNGKNTNISNCFRVTFNGNVYGLAAFNSSGADYAEYFEWEDGNPDNEDRIGKFVSLTQNGKIAIANSWNDVIGVISGMSSIVGNAQEDQYHDMYVRDIYGRFIYEDVEVERETGEFELNEDGSYKLDENEQPIHVMETVTEHRIKINPNYDATKQYVPRSQRKEWDVVGLLGQVVVEDDGTCVVGMRCTVADGGIATSGDKYRVIKRLDDNHIVVLANFLN